MNSKWTEIYGVSIQGVLNFCKDTWWVQIIWTIVSMVLGGLKFKIQLFSLFFGNLLWLIYALYYILKGNLDTDFPPVILFIKIFVAEKVAKSPAEWCRVVFTLGLD